MNRFYSENRTPHGNETKMFHFISSLDIKNFPQDVHLESMLTFLILIGYNVQCNMVLCRDMYVCNVIVSAGVQLVVVDSPFFFVEVIVDGSGHEYRNHRPECFSLSIEVICGNVFHVFLTRITPQGLYTKYVNISHRFCNIYTDI